MREAFEAALPATERLALKVIASYGALSNDDGFYKAAQRFADDHFGNGEAMERLHAAMMPSGPTGPRTRRSHSGTPSTRPSATWNTRAGRPCGCWVSASACVWARVGDGRLETSTAQARRAALTRLNRCADARRLKRRQGKPAAYGPGVNTSWILSPAP